MLNSNRTDRQEVDNGPIRWNGAANHAVFDSCELPVAANPDADLHDAVFYQQALPGLLSHAEGLLLGGNWHEAARVSSQLLAVDTHNQRVRAIRDAAVSMASAARGANGYGGVLAVYARHLLEIGEARHALQFALQSLEQQSDPVLAGSVRAAALVALGDRDEALRSLNQLCRAAPDDAYARTLRARLHLSMSNFSDALADANELLRRHGTHIDALEVQAQANMALGRTRQVFFDATNILKLKPDHASAQRWLWAAR